MDRQTDRQTQKDDPITRCPSEPFRPGHKNEKVINLIGKLLDNNTPLFIFYFLNIKVARLYIYLYMGSNPKRLVEEFVIRGCNPLSKFSRSANELSL